MENGTYYSERNRELLLRIRALATTMPTWFTDFLRAVEPTTSPLTRLNYTYDTRVFLTYLQSQMGEEFAGRLCDISPARLDTLTLKDFEKYIEYLGLYVKASVDVSGNEQLCEMENDERGKARKTASLRTLFKYLYKHQLIQSNPTALLDMPKLHEKAIVRFDPEEVAAFVDSISSGKGLSAKELKYHAKTVKRDLAMCTLFLTTGIRVSELVGLNIRDIDMENLRFVVTRKGGNQAILYFGFETCDVLFEYLEERKARATYSVDAPLFLSMQNTRITVRAVENLVKKYAKIVSPLKKITPHKLRSTYGTMLYNETGDIYLVADVLGHRDVNTTRKHYATPYEEKRRQAAEAIHLRPED